MPHFGSDGAGACCFQRPTLLDGANLGRAAALPPSFCRAFPMKRPARTAIGPPYIVQRKKKTTQARLRPPHPRRQPEPIAAGNPISAALLEPPSGWRSLDQLTGPSAPVQRRDGVLGPAAPSPNRSIPAPPPGWQGRLLRRVCRCPPNCSGASTIQPRSCAVCRRSCSGRGHPHIGGNAPWRCCRAVTKTNSRQWSSPPAWPGALPRLPFPQQPPGYSLRDCRGP